MAAARWSFVRLWASDVTPLLWREAGINEKQASTVAVAPGGFESVDNTIRWIDPHSLRIWEEPSDADEMKMFISRAYLRAR